jgi:hypothetical protein
MKDIIKVFAKGNEECNHEWVSKLVESYFTFPPIHLEERICSECGRYEMTKGSELIDFDNEEFKNLKKKFSL